MKQSTRATSCSRRRSRLLGELLRVVSLLTVVSCASPRRPSWRLPGRRYQVTDDDDWTRPHDDDNAPKQYPLRIVSGRDFDLFDSAKQQPKGQAVRPNQDDNLAPNQDLAGRASAPDLSQGVTPLQRQGDISVNDNIRTVRQASTTKDGNSYHFYSRNAQTNSRTPKFSEYGRSSSKSGSLFLIPPPVAEWWTSNVTPNIKNLPKLQCRVDPITTLKIRKTFRPLKTIVQLGADYNTQLGVWQFKSSWEDAIIGGKLTLAGRELQLTKSWQLSVGAVEDLVTRLRLRAAVDLQNYKAYVRVGFRTERLAPINVMEGFTLLKQVPLDGNAGHVKLEVKANVALPEPEIEYSTETQRSLIGMGNIEVSIEELNLVLDY